MKNIVVYVLIGLGVFAYKVSTDVDRDETGTIVGEGNVDAFNIKLGDCFNETASLAGDEPGEVSSLPGTPCSGPHDFEVFAAFDVDHADFPGTDEMGNIALETCLTHFEGFVGLPYESSVLEITSLYPTAESWARQNDREVICALFDMNGEKLTGSVKDSKI